VLEESGGGRRRWVQEKRKSRKKGDSTNYVSKGREPLDEGRKGKNFRMTYSGDFENLKGEGARGKKIGSKKGSWASPIGKEIADQITVLKTVAAGWGMAASFPVKKSLRDEKKEGGKVLEGGRHSQHSDIKGWDFTGEGETRSRKGKFDG